jgi:hypothetical protein
MVREAEPLPIEPKMKFESLTATRAPSGGYTTRMASGPTTLGTGGREDAESVEVTR